MLSFHLYLGVFATSTWGILDWRLAVWRGQFWLIF
jgi:hypothetical protein